jgi:acetoacetyl-CoA synthetase
MTNSTECLLVLLAAGAIGAIFSSTAPDMGETGIIDRYLQIQPSLLFVDSEVFYGGTVRDYRPKMKSVAERLQVAMPVLQKVIVASGRSWSGRNV